MTFFARGRGENQRAAHVQRHAGDHAAGKRGKGVSGSSFRSLAHGGGRERNHARQLGLGSLSGVSITGEGGTEHGNVHTRGGRKKRGIVSGKAGFKFIGIPAGRKGREEDLPFEKKGKKGRWHCAENWSPDLLFAVRRKERGG